MSELQYEPTPAARPIVVEHDGSTTRIIVHMQGLYAPIPRWVGELDVLTLVVAPIWLAATLLIRVCLRLPNPPRAVFEVSDDQLRMMLRDRASGATTQFMWPRAAVLEARANRYGPGLWINVAGHVKETYFSELPRNAIEQLETALTSALKGTEKVQADVQH